MDSRICVRSLHTHVRMRARGADLRPAQRRRGGGAGRPAAVPAGGSSGPAECPACRHRPVRQADSGEGRGEGRRIGRRSLSPHESDRGAGSRGCRGSCRSPTAGTGEQGTGRCAGRVAGVPEAAGRERAAAGVRKAGREDGTVPGMPGDAPVSGGCRRNGAEASRKAAGAAGRDLQEKSVRTERGPPARAAARPPEDGAGAGPVRGHGGTGPGGAGTPPCSGEGRDGRRGGWGPARPPSGVHGAAGIRALQGSSTEIARPGRAIATFAGRRGAPAWYDRCEASHGSQKETGEGSRSEGVQDGLENKTFGFRLTCACGA